MPRKATLVTIDDATAERIERHSSPADQAAIIALANGLITADLETGLIYSARWKPGKAKGCIDRDGYVALTVQFNGMRRQPRAHRVVWLASGQDIPDGLMLDHINRNKSDNRLSNLRLVDALGNAHNSPDRSGDKCPTAKLTWPIVNQIRAGRVDGKTIQQLADEFCVHRMTVWAIIHEESWKIVA